MDEKDAWDIYFIGCVGWGLHPGYQRENTEKLSMDDCATLADQMLQKRRERWPTGEQ